MMKPEELQIPSSPEWEPPVADGWTSADARRLTPRTPLTPNGRLALLLSLTEPRALKYIEENESRKEAAEARRRWWRSCALKLFIVLALSMLLYYPFIKTAGSSIFVPREQATRYVYTCPSGEQFEYIPNPADPNNVSAGTIVPYPAVPANISTPPDEVDAPPASRDALISSGPANTSTTSIEDIVAANADPVNSLASDEPTLQEDATANDDAVVLSVGVPAAEEPLDGDDQSHAQQHMVLDDTIATTTKVMAIAALEPVLSRLVGCQEAMRSLIHHVTVTSPALGACSALAVASVALAVSYICRRRGKAKEDRSQDAANINAPPAPPPPPPLPLPTTASPPPSQQTAAPAEAMGKGTAANRGRGARRSYQLARRDRLKYTDAAPAVEAPPQPAPEASQAPVQPVAGRRLRNRVVPVA